MTTQTKSRPMRAAPLLLRQVITRAERVFRAILRLPKSLQERTSIRKKRDAWRRLAEDQGSDETHRLGIIALGMEVLRRRQRVERAFDLLGLDGISLPISAARRR